MSYELKSAKEVEVIAREDQGQRAACIDYAKVKYTFLVERKKNFRARGWQVTITKIEAMQGAADDRPIGQRTRLAAPAPAAPAPKAKAKAEKTMPPKTLAGIVESFLIQAHTTGQAVVKFYIGKAFFQINTKEMKAIKDFCKRIGKMQKYSVQDFNPA